MGSKQDDEDIRREAEQLYGSLIFKTELYPFNQMDSRSIPQDVSIPSEVNKFCRGAVLEVRRAREFLTDLARLPKILGLFDLDSVVTAFDSEGKSHPHDSWGPAEIMYLRMETLLNNVNNYTSNIKLLTDGEVEEVDGRTGMRIAHTAVSYTDPNFDKLVKAHGNQYAGKYEIRVLHEKIMRNYNDIIVAISNAVDDLIERLEDGGKFDEIYATQKEYDSFLVHTYQRIDQNLTRIRRKEELGRI